MRLRIRDSIDTAIYLSYHYLLQYIAIIGKRRHTGLEKMIEENIIARKKMHEEAMTRQDKFLDIVDKLLKK